MLSKELLSEVLGIDIIRFSENHRYIMIEVLYEGLINGTNYDIYYIAHKCKEKAVNDYDVYISSCPGEDREAGDFYTASFKLNGKVIDMYADTEPSVIFKAYLYIKKNIKG